jgi:UDP-glucose 4-epimerase
VTEQGLESGARESVAVFGAAGYIGARLTRALTARGTAVARFGRATPLLDGGRPVPALRAARTVYYLAGGLSPATAEQNPGLVAEGREAFAALLDALRRVGHRPTLVLAGSGGTVYDLAAQPPYAEDAPVRPTTAYGRACLALEQLARDAQPHLDPIVVRLANVYGPHQPARRGYGVLSHWLRALSHGETLRVYGPVSASRDYVHVEDVVDALLRIHEKATGQGAAALPRVLNIGSGAPTSLLELLGMLTEACPETLRAEFAPARPFDRTAVWLDISAAARHLGWRPARPLPEGVRECWEATKTPEPEQEQEQSALPVGPG